MEKRIKDILNEINEDIITYIGDNMVRDGIIDSFEIIDIVSSLEEEFDIEIDAKYVVEENFLNMEAIVELVKMIKL